MEPVDVILTRLIVGIYGILFLILFVANFKRTLILGYQEIFAQAEERWGYSNYEMWVAIVFHSIAETFVFLVLSLIRPIEIVINLPSAIEQIRREMRKKNAKA